MSYQVIARKWRPQSFQEVVGQAHITQTLQNALANGRIPHAILFTGPRGTGKTTSARILAKALRCPNAQNFIPCNTCSSCEEIASSSSVDVVEIDGASNNGVDSIRDLRETVGYMPSSGTYKVYIIDEVHMLSTSAFNALLKTLEEPPPHIIFIMATTEVHKIPQTILSRCQRFDFRRISIKEIANHLKHICNEDQIQTDDEALWLVAKQADGSMRDSQSLLDQVITFANGPLTKPLVQQILGLTDRELLFNTLELILTRDNRGMVMLFQNLKIAGIEPDLFFQELIELSRHLLVIKISAAEATNIIEIPESEFERLAFLTQKCSQEDIHLLFDMLLKAFQDLNYATDPMLVVEMLLLRLASGPKIIDLQQLLSGSTQHTMAVISPTANTAITATPVKSTTLSTTVIPQVSSSIVVETPASPPPKVVTKQRASGTSPADKWIHFIQLLRSEDALFAAKLENVIFNSEVDKKLSLSVPKHLVFIKDQLNELATKKKLQGYIDSLWGDGYAFEVVMQSSPQGETAQALMSKKTQLAEEELKQKILNDPKVIAAQKAFKGSIKSVTDIKSNKD
ncbi:MAG: DNA polymerase III subunit gamma/tau [Bdellovibrionaceae bacterium]|nr:DNA polymerase III subunit gamma/tau [Pseudobdellovibrionaceae bacterium]NUM58529.1 DNA polymerase III subunit gamma/tau [Pseudobdellovibrionaceae bacterium]